MLSTSFGHCETSRRFVDSSNLEHDDVDERPGRDTLERGGEHGVHGLGVCLGDGDPDGDAQGADEAEGGEVGEEQRLLDAGLPELQTHAERDHKLVTSDRCNTRFLELV